MVKLWAYKVENNVLGAKLEDVPERYYQQVLDILIADGLYDEEGNRL